MDALLTTWTRERGRTDCLSRLQWLFSMPVEGTVRRSCSLLCSNSSTRCTVTGICYERICPSSRIRNGGVKRWQRGRQAPADDVRQERETVRTEV